MKDAVRAEQRLAIARDELAALRREHELALAELDALKRGGRLRALALRASRVAVPRQTSARVRRRLRGRG